MLRIRLRMESPHRSPRSLRGVLAFAALAAVWWGSPQEAEAQYKSQQFGFEGGYSFIDESLGLDEHAPIVGLRAGYKATDHWWFTARAMVSFRGDVFPQDQTVILFHLTPVDVRYYFETDAWRPYIGGQTTFQFLANTNVPSTIQWGVGPVLGMEFKLRRDLFLGVQVDGLYMIAFDADPIPALHATTQLIFFL